jgi:hypothetical protein
VLEGYVIPRLAELLAGRGLELSQAELVRWIEEIRTQRRLGLPI